MSKIDTQGMGGPVDPNYKPSGKPEKHKPATVKPRRVFTDTYAKEMKIKNRKYFVIDFNNLLKKPLKEIVSSENAKRLAQSEIEKIIKFGLKSNDL